MPIRSPRGTPARHRAATDALAGQVPFSDQALFHAKENFVTDQVETRLTVSHRRPLQCIAVARSRRIGLIDVRGAAGGRRQYAGQDDWHGLLDATARRNLCACRKCPIQQPAPRKAFLFGKAELLKTPARG